MSKRGIFEAEWQPKKIVLDFNDGVIGAKVGSNPEERYLLLKYTKKIPEHKITLKLSIWGGTSISFQLGFLHSGDNYDKYGYVFNSVSKEGWDKKNAEWFNTLVRDGVEKLQNNETKIVSGSLADLPIGIGTNLVINISEQTLEKVLPELVNNFLKYNGLEPNFEYSKLMPKSVYDEINRTTDEIIKLASRNAGGDWVLTQDEGFQTAVFLDVIDDFGYTPQQYEEADEKYGYPPPPWEQYDLGGSLGNDFNYEIGGL